MSSEVKKEETLGMFVSGLALGVLLATVVSVGVAFYAKNEHDRDVTERLQTTQIVQAEMDAGEAKREARALRGAHYDLVERIEKLEAKHRCKCGEECDCEQCECPVLGEKECECSDPSCDWPAKAQWYRPACPRFASPPRGCTGHSCQPPRLPAPLPVPVPGYEADDAYGIPEV